MPDIQLRQIFPASPDLSHGPDGAETDLWHREQFPYRPDLSHYPVRWGIQQPATGPQSRTLTADAGALVFTGADSDLVYTPAGGTTYTLTADPGALTFSFSAATLTVARRLDAQPGSLTLTGQNATLTGPSVTPSVTITGAGSARRRRRHYVIGDKHVIVDDRTDIETVIAALAAAEGEVKIPPAKVVRAKDPVPVDDVRPTYAPLRVDWDSVNALLRQSIRLDQPEVVSVIRAMMKRWQDDDDEDIEVLLLS